MRTKKSLRNMFVGFGGQGLSFIISFVNRIVFIHYLSAEYLGVNGLFSNVIGMLRWQSLESVLRSFSVFTSRLQKMTGIRSGG